MRRSAFFIWLITLGLTLIFQNWELALIVLFLPAVLGIVLLVNDWCLAPLRRAAREQELEVLYWEHPDPTMPDPLPMEDEELKRIISRTRINGSRNGKVR